MEATLYGACVGRVVALVGVWDPLLEAHFARAGSLIAYASSHAATPLIVLLDPDPGILQFGPSRWPTFNDVDTRIAMLLEFGCPAVLKVSFGRAGLNASAEEFFRVLLAHVELDELWLGARQAL